MSNHVFVTAVDRLVWKPNINAITYLLCIEVRKNSIPTKAYLDVEIISKTNFCKLITKSNLILSFLAKHHKMLLKINNDFISINKATLIINF